MKIVVINASPRKNGATAKILNVLVENLSAISDVEIVNINLSDLRLNFCLGCCQCYKSGSCHINDDVEMLSGLISSADGVIIGTPTYVSSISGQLKTFIDRGHFVIEQLLKGKYTMGIVTYENVGGRSALNTLRKLFIFSGARRFDKLMVKLPFNSNPIENRRIMTAIKKKGDNLYMAISEKKAPTMLCAIINFFVFNFGIKPFVIKKGDRYGGVLKHWEMRNIAYE